MNDDEDDKPLGPKIKMMPTSTTARTGLTREVQAKIGQQLRALYNEVVDQGVPDRFVDLLQRLDQKTNREPEAGSEGRGLQEQSKDQNKESH